MLVGAAGMIVEMFVAGLAMFVWAAVEPGSVRTLAHNAMVIGSISTLLSFKSHLPFDNWEHWRDVRKEPLDVQRKLLRDPAVRARLIEIAARPYDGTRVVGAEARPPEWDWFYLMNGIGRSDGRNAFSARRRMQIESLPPEKRIAGRSNSAATSRSTWIASVSRY